MGTKTVEGGKMLFGTIAVQDSKSMPPSIAVSALTEKNLSMLLKFWITP